MLAEDELSAKTQLPKLSTVADFFEGLFGEDIDVKASAAKTPVSNDVTVTFVDADGELVGACLLNLKLAASLGASWVRIPADAALEAATSKKLSGMLRDAVYEVLNIAAQLFRTTDIRHRIVLSEVFVPGQPVPDKVAAQIKKPAADLNVDVSIPRYTSGVLTILIFGD